MSFMRSRRSWTVILLAGFSLFLLIAAPNALRAQGNSGTIQGTVVDPSKAAVPGATVRVQNPVSAYATEVKTDTDGAFRIPNLPFNPYHLTVTAMGFATYTRDVDVRSTVPVVLTDISLQIGSATTNITVTEAADILEVTPTSHTDVDRNLFDKLPLESVSSSISSLITLSTPGVAADSNGFMHGLGEHQENAFSVDGQPITDQQSKVFSNQIPVGSVQSLEAVHGIPPAEYGDKTTLIINVTTRSGLSLRPTGNVSASYGSFGTGNGEFDFGVGSQRWGNFITATGLQSSRFLDPPEFTLIHDQGNSENIFDRVDFQPRAQDSIHLNINTVVAHLLQSFMHRPMTRDLFERPIMALGKLFLGVQFHVSTPIVLPKCGSAHPGRGSNSTCPIPIIPFKIAGRRIILGIND